MTLKTSRESEAGTVFSLAFQNEQHRLELICPEKEIAEEYAHDAHDNYWKYSLFVNDIQRVYRSLLAHGHEIGTPFQFEKIGYLSHTKDVENYQIEFIQKHFAANTKETLPKKKYPLAECPVLGLLTIRTKDPIKIIRFYEDMFQLKLLVRMYVDRGNGFTLYFLGDQDLVPPRVDIDAIENREWMYQQDHLFIEIQHYWGSEYDSDFVLNIPKQNQMGLGAIKFRGGLAALKNRLERSGLQFGEVMNKETSLNEIHLQTIDHHQIVVVEG